MDLEEDGSNASQMALNYLIQANPSKFSQSWFLEAIGADGLDFQQIDFSNVKADMQAYLADYFGLPQKDVEEVIEIFDTSFWQDVFDDLFKTDEFNQLAEKWDIGDKVDRELFQNLVNSDEWKAAFDETAFDNMISSDEFQTLLYYPVEVFKLIESEEFQAVFSMSDVENLMESAQMQAIEDEFFNVEKYQNFIDSEAFTSMMTTSLGEIDAMFLSKEFSDLVGMFDLVQDLVNSEEFRAAVDPAKLQAFIRTDEFRAWDADNTNEELLMKMMETDEYMALVDPQPFEVLMNSTVYTTIPQAFETRTEAFMMSSEFNAVMNITEL